MTIEKITSKNQKHTNHSQESGVLKKNTNTSDF
jgi:hypothetical protein